MNNAELLQQLAALNWLFRSSPANSSSSTSAEAAAGSSSSDSSTGEDEARKIYGLITGARVVDEIYQRVTKKREIDEAWSGLILRVVEFVKKNPRAGEKEQVEFVQKELKAFEIYVNAL